MDRELGSTVGRVMGGEDAEGEGVGLVRGG